MSAYNKKSVSKFLNTGSKLNLGLCTSSNHIHKLFKLTRFKSVQILLKLKDGLVATKYKKYKFIDQSNNLISMFSNKWFNYKNKSRHLFQIMKLLNYLGYTQISSKLHQYKIISGCEQRLDVILMRSKFCLTLESARNWISNGSLRINNKQIISHTYRLKPGDLIQFNCEFNQYELILAHINKWPIPLKNLIINYKTKQILVFNLKFHSLLKYFPIHLNLSKL